jgi:DNA-binding response OmpR family regulator
MPNAALKFNFRVARVGVLESSPFAATITRTMLSGFGFRDIANYQSPEMAAKKMLSDPIDILLCDPAPAHQKIFDLLSELRTPKYGEVSLSPIIIVSAKVNIDVVKAARQCKVDFVIAKPCSPRVLLDRIIWSASKKDRRNSLTLPSAMTSSAAADGDVELW